MYPVMKSAVTFFMDFLVDYNGNYVTNPSISPENTYILPDGTKGCVCYGPSMDSQILRDLFSQFLLSAKEVNEHDQDFVNKATDILNRLPQIRVGSQGQILEWIDEYGEAEPGHRHISHLYALHPSFQIEMGKTPEMEVNLNKDYFGRYSDDVSGKLGSGFVNVVVLKDGYGKHMELDYSVYPGASIYLVKVELKKRSKNTVKVNSPDIENVENIMKSYEKFEGGGLKSDNMVKYSVAIKDESGKPIQDAKIVVPEAQLSVKTNQKGICQFEIPYDDSSAVNYPIKKEYGEITILTYKDGYPSMVLLRTPVNKDGKDNNAVIKLKKAENGKIKCNVIEPKVKWVNKIFESYK
jgi:hypothetical protein